MLESFRDRMRSRKLVEWTIAYLAAGFALLQLADFLKEAFNWPTVVLRVLTVVVALGFFAALTLAWYHGEKGHQRAQTTEIALLTVIAALTISISWYVAVSPSSEGASAGAGNAPSAETRFALSDPAAAAASVAVLPFVNMTPDGQNEYLTDGITEDIITELGRMQGLRVISRTSVMRYKGSNKNIREIASELSVGTILEGSVRVQGNQVRIVAQLIDAATDTHIWSESYDRGLQDILAVQSEVSRAIADALNARLLPSALASSNETIRSVDPDAYRLFQRAKAMSNTTDEAQRTVAAALLDSAIAKDPDFAQAWSARVNLQVPVAMDAAFPETPPSPAADSMIEMATKAMDANPNKADARVAVNMIRAIRTRDIEGAENAAREAIQSHPNSVSDRLRFAQILYARGKSEEAATEIRAAASLDPMSPAVHAQVGEYLMAAGHHGDAEKHLRRAVELDTASSGARISLGLFLADQGRLEEAIRELEMARTLAPHDANILGPLGYTLARAGRAEEARTIVGQLEKVAGRGRVFQTGVAQVYVGLGETQQAADWLKKGMTSDDDRGTTVFFSPRMHQQLEQIRQVPEMARLLDSLNFRFEFRGPPDSLRRSRPVPPGSGSRSGRLP